ncbi:hypothetical protein [Mycobacterium montefiorense]|nr:hypothetical protein [Mycobacterium montefiorense]MCV7428805.1 hypothetical protein [Mycobacterium montefiorense]
MRDEATVGTDGDIAGSQHIPPGSGAPVPVDERLGSCLDAQIRLSARV